MADQDDEIIDQNDIDALMKGPLLDAPSAEEEVTEDQEVAMEEEKKEESAEATEEGSAEEKPATDAEVVDFSEDGDFKRELDNIENEELQGDIDNLLDDSDDDADDDWEQDSLISQDDIEDLIKSSENEDEDALGDLDDFDSSDIESSLDENIPEKGDDEEGKEKSKEKKKKNKKKRSIKIGKKFVLIAASVIFIVGVSVLGGLLFLKDKKSDFPKQKTVAKPVPVEEPVVESVEINVDEKTSKPAVSGTMSKNLLSEPIVMKDFVILAPETIEGLAYVEAEITIDYSTDNAYYELKKNMPLYRDVIYLAILKALGSSKGDKITESDLLVIVKKALIDAMPEGSIKKVGFNNFKTG
jgi:flagellar basal body-associated protein FliL